MDGDALPAHRWLWLVVDSLIAEGAHALLLVIRLQGHVPAEWWTRFVGATPVIVASYVCGGLLFDTSSRGGTGIRVVGAALIGGVAVLLVMTLTTQLLPISVVIASSLACMLFMELVRTSSPGATLRPLIRGDDRIRTCEGAQHPLTA